MQSSTLIGNPQDLFEAKVSALVAKRALPEVVGYIVKKRGPKKAEQDLRDIGAHIARRMLMVWTPKHFKPFQLVKEAMRDFFGNTKIKGKIIERFKGKTSKIVIRDYDCPLCPERTKEELEITEIHYCVAISGFLEAIFDHLIKNRLVPFSKIRCKTIESVGSGHSHCEHVLEMEYGVR